MASGKICQCLDSVLPRDANQSVGVYYTGNPEHFSDEEHILFQQIKKKPRAFKKKLKSYGLDSFRIKCLMLRFVFNYSYAQIAEEMHAPTKWVVFDTVKSALQMLKERGYK